MGVSLTLGSHSGPWGRVFPNIYTYIGSFFHSAARCDTTNSQHLPRYIQLRDPLQRKHANIWDDDVSSDSIITAHLFVLRSASERLRCNWWNVNSELYKVLFSSHDSSSSRFSQNCWIVTLTVASAAVNPGSWMLCIKPPRFRTSGIVVGAGHDF